MKIIKKNGLLEDFNGEKIKVAIRKSAERALVKLTPDQEREVVAEVAYQCTKYELLMQDDTPVAEVHKMVEKALRGIVPEVAEAYANYRNYKITFVSMMDNILKYQNEVLFLGDRSNANTDSALNTTQATLIGNEALKELYNEFSLNAEEQEACKAGYLYVHDKNRRLISTNCCLFDVKAVLEYGVEMSGVKYTQPKYLNSVMGVIKDIVMTAGSQQYGGITVQSIDELLAPYVKRSYEQHKQEIIDVAHYVTGGGHTKLDGERIHEKAMEETVKELEQGIQAMEIAFNTLPSSRGDFVFVTYTFGLGTDEWSRLVARKIMEVRNGGQGAAKVPMLFPKLVYLFDEELHDEGKPMREDFKFAVYCQSQTMFPDLLGLTGASVDNDANDVYKKYHVATSPMGCRSYLSPYFERGEYYPADEDDKPVTVGRGNLGVISLNLPMIYQRAKVDGIDFYELLDKYLEMACQLHLKTKTFLGGKKASTHPLAYCQGGFYGGHLQPDDKIAPVLESFTASIGITALHELTVLHSGHSLYEDNTFAKEVMQHINDYCARFKEENHIMVSTYGTPAESLCGTQLKQFVKMFGVIPGVSDKEYFSNSFHCDVREEINPFQKQDAEFELFHMMNGGHIQYVRIDNKNNFEANLALADRAMKLGYYFGVNFNNCICMECGHNELDMGDTCPNCGGHDITEINRVSGYLGYSRIHGDTRFNEGKRAELRDRKSM